MNPILQIDNLCVTYPNGTQGLKRVSFDVQQGSFLAVVGLSGSGKSTMLRSVNHLVEPTGGRILFKGRDITHVTGSELRQLRQKIAMIFQQFNLVGRHSVMNNVLMGRLSQTGTLASLGGMFNLEDRARATACLDLMGISEKARMRADQLSGGQQQRVAIARALVQEPEILLADEPVASLDPAMCHTVMDYLEKINGELGITVICNLHFLSLVRRYATWVVALKSGEVVFSGSPKEVNEAWCKRIYGDTAREVHAT